jgi:hypothetical protein
MYIYIYIYRNEYTIKLYATSDWCTFTVYVYMYIWVCIYTYTSYSICICIYIILFQNLNQSKRFSACGNRLPFFVYIHIYVYVYAICTCTYICTYVYIYIYIYIYIYTYIYIYVLVCIHTYVYIDMYLCIYIYLYSIVIILFHNLNQSRRVSAYGDGFPFFVHPTRLDQKYSRFLHRCVFVWRHIRELDIRERDVQGLWEQCSILPTFFVEPPQVDPRSSTKHVCSFYAREHIYVFVHAWWWALALFPTKRRTCESNQWSSKCDSDMDK